MTDTRQFGANKPAAEPASKKEPLGQLDCSRFELLLAESVEQTLPENVAEQVHTHANGCAACRDKLAQARRGREWLLVVKQESLEPSAGLVAKILARTSLAGAPGAASTESALPSRPVQDILPGMHSGLGAASVPAETASGHKERRRGSDADYLPGDGSAARSIPAWQHSSVVVLRRTFIEPRLALVAAMAFFSVALTLNLLGVRLTGLHASDLTPRNMHRAVTRQYAEANARVVRYYENLRIVYEMEARVQQLRRAAQTTTPSQQPARPRKQSFDSTGDSSSSTAGSHPGRMANNPLARDAKHAISPGLPDPKPIVTGPEVDALLRVPSAEPGTAPTLAALSSPSIPLRPALLAASCPLHTTGSSMRYFSTRERRLA